MTSANTSAEPIVTLTEPPVDEASARHQRLVEKVDEALFYINMVKNSAAVSFSDHEVLTNLYTGQLMYLDDRDVSVTPHVVFHGIWEAHSTRVLREILSPGDVFFDVGANFGYFSLLAGIEVAPTAGSLHLFEANPDLIRYLERSLAVNGLIQYANINNVAVSDEPGTLTLNRIKHLWGGATMLDLDTLSRYRPVEDSFDASYDVPAITIDDYVKANNVDRVDLVKIDVEGLEDRVYAGMAATIAANPELKVFLEFTRGAYAEPAAFFHKMTDDFAHIYIAPEERHGELLEITDFDDVSRLTGLEIAMLLLTNRPIDGAS